MMRQIYKHFFTNGVCERKIQKIISTAIPTIGQSQARPLFLLSAERGWSTCRTTTESRRVPTSRDEADSKLSTARLSTARRRTTRVVSVSRMIQRESETKSCCHFASTLARVSRRASRVSTRWVSIRVCALQLTNDNAIGVKLTARSHIDSRLKADLFIAVFAKFVLQGFDDVFGIDS